MDLSAILPSAMGTSPGDTDPSLRGAHTPAAQRKAVAGQFEAILLRQFLSGSVGSMLGGDDSASGSVYGYMLTDVLSQKLAQGAGMGLGKMIEKQLAPKGAPAADKPLLPPAA
jgi:Rod binding domain-containing protein